MGGSPPKTPEPNKAYPKRSARSVTQQEVEAVRASVHKTLAAAQQDSQSSGKPLLILVGEDHYSQHAVFLEAIIYQEARALGVKDIAIELPLHPKGKDADLKQSLVDSCFSRQNFKGHITTLHQANYFNHSIHYVDGRHDLAVQGIEKATKATNPDIMLAMKARNETMAANLTRIDLPTMAIMGADHLQGIERRMKNFDTHELVSFDVSEPAMTKALQVKPSIGGHKLAIAGNMTGLQPEKLMPMALGEEEGSAFIAWEEANGKKLTTADIIKRKEDAIDLSKIYPHDLEVLKQKIQTLYELGNDKEAGKSYAQFQLEKLRNPKSVIDLDINALTTTNAFINAENKELTRLEPQFKAAEEKQVAEILKASKSNDKTTAKLQNPAYIPHHSAESSAVKSAREESPFYNLFEPLIKAWEEQFSDHGKKVSSPAPNTHQPAHKQHNTTKLPPARH